jgi:hypothetical protein
MSLRCLVVRGLVKEVEEEINKFLSSHRVNVVHMAQSETGPHISVTLIFQEPHPLPDDDY